MTDRYSGDWDTSYNGDDHIVGSETKNGTEYYYCKACKLGIPSENKTKSEAEEKLNELSCPPTEEDRHQNKIAKKGFIALDKRHR